MKRNIIVFLCDQLRPDFLPIYGCDAVPAPSLQRLASQGCVFDHAITQSAVCGPARASMLTGRYVSDHGVWTNDMPFRAGLEYLPERMNDLGYATAAFGKLHHYPPEDVKGFQYVRLMEESRLSGQDPYYQWLRSKHPEVKHIFNHADLTFRFPEEDYYEHWIASEAIAYIRQHRETVPDQPFLAWVSFQGPHMPLDPPAEVKGSVDTSRLPQPIVRLEEPSCPIHRYRQVIVPPPKDLEEAMRMRTAYGEMIVEIDRQIGRVLQALEELGIADETSLIFSADHGDLLGDLGQNSKGPFPYQGQLGIPLVLANHPDVMPASRSDSLVGNIDIPGTVLAIAGAERGMGVSRSLIDQAQRAPRHPREVNFSELWDSIKIVEDKRYRFCYYPFLGCAELYDRQEDPKEQVNLAGRDEYLRLQNTFMQHIMDFQIIAKGIRILAWDFVPEQQEGVIKKHPTFEDEFPVSYPLMSKRVLEELAQQGLSTTYNEFCKHHDILAHYGLYWE